MFFIYLLDIFGRNTSSLEKCWIYLSPHTSNWAKDVTLWPEKTRKILQMSIYGEKDVNQSYVRQQRPWHRFSAEQKRGSSSPGNEFAAQQQQRVRYCWEIFPTLHWQMGKNWNFFIGAEMWEFGQGFWHGVQVNITLTDFNFALTILFSSSPIVTGRDRTASVGSTS